MPRKKAKSQTIGETLGIRMPKTEREATLKALDGLPSMFYAFLCQTNDQIQAFKDIKAGYQFIKADIQALFAGEAEVIHSLPPDQRDFWGLMSDRYLAWYMVVQRGWQYLEKEWQSDERLANFQTETPGTALIQMLELESQGFLESSFSERYRFAPSQHRRWVKSERDIARRTATAKTEKAMQVELTVKGQQLQSFAFSQVCLEICRKNAKEDERLKVALKHYDTVVGALDRVIQKKLHPRVGMKGYEWRNGIKYKTAFKGSGHGERFNSA